MGLPRSSHSSRPWWTYAIELWLWMVVAAGCRALLGWTLWPAFAAGGLAWLALRAYAHLRNKPNPSSASVTTTTLAIPPA